MADGSDLYIIQMRTTGDFKVGRTNNVQRRLKELQTGSPHTLRVLLHAIGQGHKEKRVHQALAHRSTRHGQGEWFLEEAFGSLPLDIYNQFTPRVLEDPDWWRN